MNPEHRQLVDSLLEIQLKIDIDGYVPSEQQEMLAYYEYIRAHRFQADLAVLYNMLI